jgi:hypothetical protein
MSGVAGSQSQDTGVLRLEALHRTISSQRARLLAHPIYATVVTLPLLRRFMSRHVYAVWDFMCLAKRLQRDLTSVDTLWRPPARPSLARFINSVILCEESDVDPEGRAASHFDLYVAAMTEIGAPSDDVRQFLRMVEDGADVQTALAAAGAPPAVRAFVTHTLDTVERGTTIEALSSFLFGREDLIPEMFARFCREWDESRDARLFTYYVHRHIEVDGDDHAPAAQRALAEIAGSDDHAWLTAGRAAESAISARIKLWDGIYSELVGP